MEAVKSSAIMQVVHMLRLFRNCPVLFGLALLLAPRTASQEKPSTLCPAPADQEQIVAYWTTETGWKSELQLRNNQIGRELTVTRVLRTAYGAETSLSAVTIKPEEVKTIDLDAAIGTTAPQLAGTYGSLVLRYRSPGFRSLYASLMVRNIGRPIAFHIDAMGELENYEVASREGIWWLPNDTASDFLILTNQGKNLIQFDLSLYDATGKETKQKMTLGPRETTRYSIRKLVQAADLTGSYGGIKIFAAAHAGSFDSLHVLFDEKAGFSALLKMFDHDPNAELDERDFARTAVWTLRAPMLALSNPDPALDFPLGITLHPQLFIRNTTGKPIDAALRFNWRTDTTTAAATGPALRLNPYETRRIDVAALQDGAILPKEANWTSVTLTTKGLPDEVMAVAASYDDTLRYGAQTPFSDQLSFRWEGGMWEYDPYHNSLITAGNGGTKPTQAAFTIFYNQGAEKYELERTLQPDEQMWIDVGKLIREHVPDKNGKTLPADLNSGSYEFRDLTDIGMGSLFEGKLIYDRTYGHVTYGGCSLCCGYQSAFLTYDPLNFPFGSTSQNGVRAYDTCTDGNSDVSSYFMNNWSVVNPAIATVNASGEHTGVSVGSTTSNTWGFLATGHQRNCPASRLNTSCADIVTPGITTKQVPNVILPSEPRAPSFSSVSTSGMLDLTNQSTAPGAAGTGTVNLDTKTADKRLYYKDDRGTEIGPVGAAKGGRVTATGNNAFTGNNTHSGTETFTGISVVFCRIENIRFVDAVNGCGWTGSDIGAWIKSAISDLPSTGGKIVVGVTGNANFAAQVAPAKTVVIEGLGASYQNAGAHCITTLTWTGGASAPFVFSGTAAQGSRLAQMCLNATGTAPPVFVDVDAAAGKVELDHIVVDTPTVSATVAAFRWGNTGNVVDSRCTDTFARAAAPIGYDLLSVSGHFVGTDCRSLQNTTNEWVIGGAHVVQSVHLYGSTAEHTNAGGTAGVLINNAIAFNWDSGYFECGGATNSWCVDIPSTATLAQVVNISNSHAGGGAATGTDAFLHVDLASAVVNIFNNRIGDSPFAVGSAIVKNDSAKRVTLIGNNQSAARAVEYTSATNIYTFGNTAGGVTQPLTIPGGPISAGIVTLVAGTQSHSFTVQYPSKPNCTLGPLATGNAYKYVSSRSAIVITSSSGTDTSQVAWACSPTTN